MEGLAETSGASGAGGSESQYYNVILVTDNKEDTINDLQDRYQAINIFDPKNLDIVVTADVPITMVKKLSENHNVIKIGDGELELESLVDYDSTNPAHISIREAKEYHGLTSSITETGSGIVIGVIDQ